MKPVWSNQIDIILGSGHPLNEIGVNNWALQKDEALNALIELAKIQVPILGGDVCELTNGVIQYNYDNWYCDKNLQETKLAFVLRSIAKAKQYIENYQSKYPDKIFFALVPETE